MANQAEFLDAVSCNDMERVQACMNAGQDINEVIEVDEGRTTALMTAVSHLNIEMVRYLLLKGAHPDIEGSSPLEKIKSPLMTAVRLYTTQDVAVQVKAYNIAALLLESGAQADAVNVLGATPLITVALERENTPRAMAELLLKHHADPAKKNLFGYSAAYFSAYYGNESLVDLFLPIEGAFPDNAVLFAIVGEHLPNQSAKLLLPEHINIIVKILEKFPRYFGLPPSNLSKNINDYTSLLTFAMQKKQYAALEFMIPHAPDSYFDYTLLMRALLSRNERVIDLVMTRSHMKDRDSTGRNLLMIAATHNLTEYFAKYMHHFDVNESDSFGGTALSLAVINQNNAAIEFLFKHGAKYKLKTDDQYGVIYTSALFTRIERTLASAHTKRPVYYAILKSAPLSAVNDIKSDLRSVEFNIGHKVSSVNAEMTSKNYLLAVTSADAMLAELLLDVKAQKSDLDKLKLLSFAIDVDQKGVPANLLSSCLHAKQNFFARESAAVQSVRQEIALIQKSLPAGVSQPPVPQEPHSTGSSRNAYVLGAVLLSAAVVMAYFAPQMSGLDLLLGLAVGAGVTAAAAAAAFLRAATLHTQSFTLDLNNQKNISHSPMSLMTRQTSSALPVVKTNHVSAQPKQTVIKFPGIF